MRLEHIFDRVELVKGQGEGRILIFLVPFDPENTRVLFGVFGRLMQVVVRQVGQELFRKEGRLEHFEKVAGGVKLRLYFPPSLENFNTVDETLILECK